MNSSKDTLPRHSLEPAATSVVIADASAGPKAALESIFSAHGGVTAVIAKDVKTVYIKPNGVHFTPHTHTDPVVLEALLAYLRDNGYGRLTVFESCTGGNFTQLVFRVTGCDRICQRYGAEVLYLDEGPTVSVVLRDGTRISVSRRLDDEILNRTESPDRGGFYLNLPKLKTHPMSTVTLGVKNQQAFPQASDRMHNHSHDTLHRRLAALYALAQPDFCIIEGLTATAHGHFLVRASVDDCVVPMGILIGGADTLAVDVVGARVLGYDLSQVEHLRLCVEWGLGRGDLAHIDLQGIPLARFKRRLPFELLGRLHPEVRWVVGRSKACVEGCRGNSECIQEMLYNDHDGTGGWTLVCGSGFHDADLDELPGDILVVGACACQEAGGVLRHRYPDRRIHLVPEHNDLMNNARYQAWLMGVSPLSLVPLSPPLAALALLQARLRGLTARVPPLLG